MKIFSLFLLLGLFVSCNDSQTICDCVEAGDEANRISASFFDRPATLEGKDSLDRAIEARDELCESFQDMDFDKLHERAAECESLKINTEK